MKHLANNFPLAHTDKGKAQQVIIQWISAPAGYAGDAQTRDMFYVHVYITDEENKIHRVSFEVAEREGNWYPGRWNNQHFTSFDGNDFTRKLIPALIHSYTETEKINDTEIDGFFE